MRTNKNYYPVYIKLNIVLDKKFVWVFSIRCYGKTCTNFLANPIEKFAINLALVWESTLDEGSWPSSQAKVLE